MSYVLTVDDLRQKSSRFQLVDVRSPSEFAAGHIPGTVNLPMEQIERRMADLDPDSRVVLICKSGTRANITRGILAPQLPDVSILQGGTDAWAASGMPLVRSQSSRWSLERQVRLGAGLLVLVSLGLALWINMAWLGLTAFAGAGLTFAGATDICAMGLLLARLPWNRK